MIRRRVSPEGIITDKFGRVTFVPGKIFVPSPSQDKHTAVILFIGQSNHANYAEHFYNAAYDPQNPDDAAVVNYFNGKCAVASSPLLGASGQKGDVATGVGMRLVESGAYKKVILVASAIGGSRVAQWQPGGPGWKLPESIDGNVFGFRRRNLHKMLMKVLDRLPYDITHIVWHQGESDFGVKNRSAEEYRKSFLAMVQSLRAKGVDAPVFVSVASRVESRVRWTPDNEVVQAQRALPDPVLGIYAGVDTDALLGLEDRLDGTHMNARGQEKYVEALVPLLAAHGP